LRRNRKYSKRVKRRKQNESVDKERDKVEEN
jgi:hypothetical protein